MPQSPGSQIFQEERPMNRNEERVRKTNRRSRMLLVKSLKLIIAKQKKSLLKSTSQVLLIRAIFQSSKKKRKLPMLKSTEYSKSTMRHQISRQLLLQVVAMLIRLLQNLQAEAIILTIRGLGLQVTAGVISVRDTATEILVFPAGVSMAVQTQPAVTVRFTVLLFMLQERVRLFLL